MDIEEIARTGAVGEDAAGSGSSQEMPTGVVGSAETRSPSQGTLASLPEDSNTPTLTHSLTHVRLLISYQVEMLITEHKRIQSWGGE